MGEPAQESVLAPCPPKKKALHKHRQANLREIFCFCRDAHISSIETFQHCSKPEQGGWCILSEHGKGRPPLCH